MYVTRVTWIIFSIFLVRKVQREPYTVFEAVNPADSPLFASSDGHKTGNGSNR